MPVFEPADTKCPFWEEFPDEWEGDDGPQSRLRPGGEVCHIVYQEEVTCGGDALACPLIEGPDHRTLILKFAASFTLADHIGDVADDLHELLKMIGVKDKWRGQAELGAILANMGITTLYNTSIQGWARDD